MTGISRRSLMIGAAAGAGALALGTAPQASAATFVKGADISWMPQMEANGYYWLNKSGVRQDLFTILKSYGLTAISLRTWVNPSNSPTDGHCSIQETVKMAQRCRDAGLQVLLAQTPDAPVAGATILDPVPDFLSRWRAALRK